jgi:O-antigen/teichoic acid export membrane protein
MELMRFVIGRSAVVRPDPTLVKPVGIFRNSFWYGLELGLNVGCSGLLSIAVARVLGPAQLGHFVYLSFLTGIANRFADLGTATAARKYIAEYLSRGQMGLVRQVFFDTLKLQTVLAMVVLVIGILLAVQFVDPPFRVTACVLVASIVPGLLNSVPSQTNLAAGAFFRNFPGAIAGLTAYVVVTILSLMLGWGLVGLAAAMLLRRTAEMVGRLVPAMTWMASLPKEASSGVVYRKILNFSGQALAITAVVMIVNDRSELLFLKHFCDVKQLAFYSIAFGLSEYLLNVPQVFAGPIMSAFMSEHPRNEERAGAKAAQALRLMSMFILPAHFGLAAISAALVAVAYGRAYFPAIPAVAIIAVLAIPKAFYWMPATIYRATDQQATLLRHLVIAAVLNLFLDAVLIPRFGPIGAAIANGVSQSFAVISIWGTAARLGHLRMQWRTIVRIGGAAIAMSLLVALLCYLISPPIAIVLGIVVGALSYLVFLKLLHAVPHEDLERIAPLAKRLPMGARKNFMRFLTVIVGHANAHVGTIAEEKAVLDSGGL